MHPLRQILFRGVLFGVLAAVLGAGAFLAYVDWYTRGDRLVPGVTIGRVAVGGLTSRQASQQLVAVHREGEAVLAGDPAAEANLLFTRNPVTYLRWNERAWPVDHAGVETPPDLASALEAARKLGRTGSIWRRTQAFVAGALHGYRIPLEARLDEEKLGREIHAIAREIDRAPVDARYDIDSDTVAIDRPGRQLDFEASLAVARAAILAKSESTELIIRTVPASVTHADLEAARQFRVARFATPILAADPGRVHNISMAVRKISGFVLKPGQEFSFNEIVGPRDASHGWAPAKELYQGEFVMGYGGGICQVSSTLYNTVLLGGLEIKQRFHHSRPLQYVAPGRDATVAWNTLDFRFRNSTGAPLMVGARVLPGSPQQIEVSLYAPHRVPEGRISIEVTDLRYFPPEMEESLDARMPAGERLVTDEGHYGIEVKVYRVFHDGGRKRRELVSHDNYLPKSGKVRVGVGNAPGVERLLNPGLQ